MTELLLSVRLNPTDSITVIKVEDMNLTEKVEILRNHTAEQTNLPSEAFDLIYGGCLLENDSALDTYGLKNGSIVHVVKRIEPAKEDATINSSGASVEVLAPLFKSIVGNSRLKNALRRLTKKDEFLKNVVESTPGLQKDAVAVSLLMDPDLIVHFNHKETLKKISKLHPALMDAAQHIASAVHEEAHNFAANSNASMDSSSSSASLLGQSYSLDNLSDDEDMGEPSDSVQDQQARVNAASASILEAFGRARRSTSAGAASDGSGSSSSGANSNGGIITFEMFNQAMQQAVASTPAINEQAAFAPPPPPPAAPATFSAPQNAGAADIQRQISIMHEMGLQNDAINLQALQITNGDVQAAIELVLNGLGN